MKLLRLALLIVFSAFATSVFAQTVPMPDYSKWEKTVDHSVSYLLKDKPVEVRDMHYEFVNHEQTEEFIVLVFYHPNTEKTWFSIYIHYYSDKPPVACLYESDKNETWVFVEDVSEGNLDSVLKKFDLVEIKK